MDMTMDLTWLICKIRSINKGFLITKLLLIISPVKMFFTGRQAGKSNRQQRSKLQGPQPEYKSDKCGVSSRYFVVGSQMAGSQHILTGLNNSL